MVENNNSERNNEGGHVERKYLHININKDDGLFDLYDGEFSNNMRNGKGKMEYANGYIYEGEWKNNKREGKGTLWFQTDDKVFVKGGKEEGQYSSMKRNRKGKYTLTTVSYYEGDWKENVFHGYGVREYPNGDIFEGLFNSGKMREGTFRFASGAVFKGSIGAEDGSKKLIMKTGVLNFEKTTKRPRLFATPSTKTVWYQNGKKEAIYRQLNSNLIQSKIPDDASSISENTADTSVTAHSPVPEPSPVPDKLYVTNSIFKGTYLTSCTRVIASTPNPLNRSNISTKRSLLIDTPNFPQVATKRNWLTIAYLIYVIILFTKISCFPSIHVLEKGHDLMRPWSCNLPFAYMMSQKCWDDATLNPIYDCDGMRLPMME